MSTIYTIRENLERTIAGKEKYLEEMKSTLDAGNIGERMALNATRAFLEVNINELKVILHDVNTACSEFNLMSWEQNPDRSGGQFTQEEIDNSGRWQ